MARTTTKTGAKKAVGARSQAPKRGHKLTLSTETIHDLAASDATARKVRGGFLASDPRARC